MCLVDPPKIPEQNAPAPPPPSPETGAGYTQGTPERPWKKKYKGNLRSQLRIDMKGSDLKKMTDGGRS